MVTPVRRSKAQDEAQRLVSGSSSQPIILELTKICTNRQWLAPSHVYADVVTALDGGRVRRSRRGSPRRKGSGRELGSGRVQGAPLAEYIAYSVPLHVADGWVFLARAFDAIKAGDHENAVHMSYYAELRAAMSLLASEGVGVFNDRHVAIGPNYSTADWTGSGTHEATWELMEAWGNDPHRSSTILEAIRVEQKTINEWFDEANILQSVSHLVAGEWLKAWSIDLSFFRQDRNLRNRVSYSPTKIIHNVTAAPDFKAQVIDPLLRTWGPLQPSPDPGGAVIDQDLLAFALSRARDRDNLSQSQWDQFVDQYLEFASPSLSDYLKRPLESPYSIFTWAQDASIPPKVDAVLARATLLLRLANAVCAQQLDHANVRKDDLRFWWDRLGQECGYWTEGQEPDTFKDLWQDVADAVEDVDSFVGIVDPPITMSNINRGVGPEVALTQHSRALFWLLGLDR